VVWSSQFPPRQRYCNTKVLEYVHVYTYVYRVSGAVHYAYYYLLQLPRPRYSVPR
jgi:hypothetical protein